RSTVIANEADLVLIDSKLSKKKKSDAIELFNREDLYTPITLFVYGSAITSSVSLHGVDFHVIFDVTFRPKDDI
ncbi:hypothetical protein LTR49_027858, partial [Elasticomyces elasticus]